MMTKAVESALNGEIAKLILRPEDDGYKNINESYFTAFQNELTPSHIARPTSPDDVRNLITALRPFLVKHEIKLAIRGGGHTPWPGSSNIQDGITIDLRGLKGVTLNRDKSVARIGVGENWSSVYASLESHGLTIAGGRVGSVGVSGLLLGGGISFYSTRRGFACDSVVEFEMVTASGNIVRASADNNSDLWAALKGGLNNFGIVTAFHMKTFSLQNIWGGMSVYMPQAYPDITKALCEFATSEPDEDCHVFCAIGFQGGHQGVSCFMYSTKGKENPSSLSRFTSIEPQIKLFNTMRTGTHVQFVDELSSQTTDGNRSIYITLTVRPDAGLADSFRELYQSTIPKVDDARGLVYSLISFPLTKAMLQNSQDAGAKAMKLPPSEGPLLVVLLNPTWRSASDDERILSTVTDLFDKMKALASERNLLHPYIYANYANYANYAYRTQNVLAGYGPGCVANLREVSRKWDPEQVFQNAVPGGFKIPVDSKP